MVFQKELLYAMLGHTGQVVLVKEAAAADGGTSSQLMLARGLPLVDESERRLAERLLLLGACYRDLDVYVNAQLFGDGPTKPHAISPYIIAFALGIEECLQPYRARVLHLEQRLLRQPDLSLPALQLGFGDFELTLPALRRLLSQVERGELHGVALLDHLHATAAGCVHSLRDALRVLLRHTQRVLRSQLAAWLLHGELLPGDGDFFIQRVPRKGGNGSTGHGGDSGTDPGVENGMEASPHAIATEKAADGVGNSDWFVLHVDVGCKPAAVPMRVAEQALFVGKAVRLLRASEQRLTGSGLVDVRAPPAADAAAISEAAKLAPLFSPRAAASASTTPRGSSHRATPRSVASGMGGIGNEDGRSLGGPVPQSSPRLSASATVLSGGGVAGAGDALAMAEASLASSELAQELAAVREVEAEAEARNLLASLGQAAQGMEQRQGEEEEGGGDGFMGDRASSSAGFEMRQALHGFGDELRSLPMVDGSLQLQPLERLLTRMHRTASRLLWRHLTVECGLLDLLAAVKNYFLLGRGNIFHTLLDELRPLMGAAPPPLLDLQAALAAAVSGEPPDPHLQALRLAFVPTPATASVYDKWRALSLELQVEGPLQLLLHFGAVARYQELFRFLLLVKRVQMELHAAWNAQTQSASMPTQQRALLMPLWRLRAHMAFLLDNLQHYLQVDVLEAQWQSLMQTAETCADFEELCAAHEACLSALHAQCFLQAPSVSSALHQIFQLCLSLCRMLSYAEAGARSEATYRSQFATVSREFSRQSAFLFAFLSNMSSPQQSPHLQGVLLRLDFNQFFGGHARQPQGQVQGRAHIAM